MTELDERPPVAALAVTAVLAVVAVAATAAASVEGGAGVAAAAVLLVVGVTRQSAGALAWGVLVGAAGLVFASAGPGTGSGGEASLVVAAVALAVAWDVADHGLSLGAAVGRDARSTRNVVVHAWSSLLVGALAGGVAYGTFVAATGGQPLAALVFLLFGATVLVSAFR